MKKLIILSIIFLFCFKINAQNGKYVETNGVKIYYETHGEGDPLLLLHGFMSSHKYWDQWKEDLSKKYLLIIPDLRGHGNSTNPSNIYTHKLVAMDMYGLMDNLKIVKFKAIGGSSGGMTLIHMATMDTSRITSMILIGATSFYPEESRVIQRQISYDKQHKDRLAFLETLHPGGEKQIRQLILQFKNMAVDYNDMNFTPPYLSTITSKTLIIHGDRDVFFPIEIPLISYKAIPNSYLWIVPNAGHMPFGFYEKNSIWADVYLKVIEDFFDR